MARQGRGAIIGSGALVRKRALSATASHSRASPLLMSGVSYFSWHPPALPGFHRRCKTCHSARRVYDGCFMSHGVPQGLMASPPLMRADTVPLGGVERETRHARSKIAPTRKSLSAGNSQICSAKDSARSFEGAASRCWLSQSPVHWRNKNRSRRRRNQGWPESERSPRAELFRHSSPENAQFAPRGRAPHRWRESFRWTRGLFQCSCPHCRSVRRWSSRARNRMSR